MYEYELGNRRCKSSHVVELASQARDSYSPVILLRSSSTAQWEETQLTMMVRTRNVVRGV
jgi:hypothetical protein